MKKERLGRKSRCPDSTLYALSIIYGWLTALSPPPRPILYPSQMPKSLLPHLLQGDIAACALFIWLVLMVDNT